MSKQSVFIFPILFSLSCLFHGCYDIKDNRRVSVNGTLLDNLGNPVPGILVQSSGGANVLGYTTSDKFGMFHFISLESNASDFSITIAPGHTPNSDYLPVRYINGFKQTSSYLDTSNGTRNQNNYELGIIKLQQAAYLDLMIKKTSTSNDTLHWTVTLPEKSCEKYFIKGEIDTARSRCFFKSTRSGTLKPGDEAQNPGFETVKNVDALLDYSINNGAPQRITIPISQSRTQYVFEF